MKLITPAGMGALKGHIANRCAYNCDVTNLFANVCAYVCGVKKLFANKYDVAIRLDAKNPQIYIRNFN